MELIEVIMLNKKYATKRQTNLSDTLEAFYYLFFCYLIFSKCIYIYICD
jgi:hypothetical protein